MANGDNLVPAEIVQLIFNQVKTSTDSNTDSIKSLTEAINELMKYLLDNPSRRELLDKLDSIEHRDIERVNTILNSMYTIRDFENEKRKESNELFLECTEKANISNKEISDIIIKKLHDDHENIFKMKEKKLDDNITIIKSVSNDLKNTSNEINKIKWYGKIITIIIGLVSILVLSFSIISNVYIDRTLEGYINKINTEIQKGN